MKKTVFFILTLLSIQFFASADDPVFSPDIYARRRANLYASLPDGSAVVFLRTSNRDRHIIYYTGVDVIGATFIGVKDSGEEYLFLPPFSKSYNVSSDEQMYPGEKAQQLTGIAHIFESTKICDKIPEIASGIKFLYAQQPFSRIPRPKGLDTEITFYTKKFQAAVPEIEIRRGLRPFYKIQDIKEPREIEKITQAVKICGEGVIETIKYARPGLNEYHLEAVINFMFRHAGAKTLFHIIGSGPNSVILHHRRHIRDLQAGDLVVLDVGSEVDHYGSDITRTFPVSGRFTEEQRKIYEIVLKANKEAIAAVKPGITFQTLEKLAMKIIADAGYGEFFNHSLGHPINGGLMDELLEPGMILTIEPGIYLPDKGFGIRIEDDILVTKDGHLNLSEFVPKEVDEIEKLVQEKSLFDFLTEKK